MATAAISIGVAVGAQLLSNALTQPETVESGKVEDLDMVTSEYGSSVGRPSGRYRYFGCNMIWSTPLREVKTTTKQGGKGGGGRKQIVEEFAYFGTWASLVCEGEVDQITRIWFNGEVKYDKFATGSFATESQDFLSEYVELYTGSLTQLPDATIESVEGVGNVPALRGKCYVVFREVDMNDYGNRAIKVDVEVTRNASFPDSQDTSLIKSSLQDDLADICSLAGYTLGEDLEIKVGRLYDGSNFKNNGGTFKEYISELQKYFLFVPVLSDGKLQFISQTAYSNPPTISLSDLAARDYGSEPTTRYEYDIEQRRELPSSVEIDYRNADNQHDPGYTIATRNSAGFTNNVTYSTQLVLSDTTAFEAAQKILNQLWVQKIVFRNLSLLPKFIPWLNPGFIFNLDTGIGTRTLQITKIEIGANYLMSIEAAVYDDRFSNTPVADVGLAANYSNPLDRVEVTTADSSFPVILDIPLISSIDSDNGIYVGYTVSPGDTVLNSTLYIAPTATNDYTQIQSLGTVTTSGIFSIPLTTGDVVINEIDRSTVYTLSLNGGVAPETISEEEFRTFNQLAVLTDGIDYEIICFRVVNQIADATFEVTDVIRGMFGTDQTTFPTGSNLTYYGLNGSAFIARQSLLPSVTGTTYDYRAVPSEYNVFASSNTATEVFNNRSAQPYNPVNPRILRDAIASTHTFSWTRRTRKGGEWTQLTLDVPLNEALEQYEVELLDATFTSVLGNFVTSSPELTLNNSELVSLYGTVPTMFNFRVYQISDTVGRGIPLDVQQKSITEAK